MANEQESDNVNITLAHPNAPAAKLLGKEFPCPLCGSSMPIRITRKGKPYCHCNSCVIQLFFRGKASIQRLQEIIESGILVCGKDSAADLAVTLYNRIQLLKTQKIQLEKKRGLLRSDHDLENAISALEKEIRSVQRNLKKIARKTSRREKR